MWTDGNGFFYIGDCCSGDRAATASEVATQLAIMNPAPTLASELSSLASRYKSDTTSLSMSWLTASVSNGATEASKKAQITSDVAAVKAQYLADVAATKLKYSH